MRAAPPDVVSALDELKRCAALRDASDATMPEVVGRAMAVGCTWEEIGGALGITRQGAWKRFHAVVRP